MKKKNILLIIGILVMLIGLFLPSIRIARENISFLKENGIIPLLLVISMIILIRLEKKEYIYIPATISLVIIMRFIYTNINRLRQLNELYGTYAKYQYGVIVLIIGNILVISTLTLTLINKEKIMANIKEKITEIKEKLAKKQKENKLIKIAKQNNKKITHETTKDGKIRFNKITVKVNNEKPKETLKTKIMNFMRPKSKLSITRFDNKKEETNKTIMVPVIDIKQWTRSEICCSNCGATVRTTSEYCFLCDCKIKLKEKDVNYTQKV